MSESKPHGSPRWSSGGNPEQGEWPSNQHMSPENVIRRIERVAVEKGLRPEAALEEIESLAVGYRLAANEPRDETGYPAFSGLPRSSRVSQIAHDFAAIPFENHEAKILALAYIELQEANQWLRDDIAVKVETIERIEEQYKHLENELDDMTGQFCNEAIHLTRAEDRVRELEEQYQAAHAALSKIAHWGELSEQERRQIAGEALGIEPLAGHEHPAAQEGTASQVPYPANEPEA